MKVEFDKFEFVKRIEVPGFSVVCRPFKSDPSLFIVDEAIAESLAAELNAREAKLEELQAERDRLRAYAECMKCWRDYCHQVNEDKSDWSKTLRGHGWNPSENGPIEFMDSLLTTALSAKEENQ